MSRLPKNLHLALSAFIVICMAFVYGAHPSVILPYIFGFEVQNLELKNIFRAVMGIYLAFGGYWVYGILKPNHWRSATIVNILFMGGLAVGRLISTILDGWSPQYGVGMIAEAVMIFLGIYNLKRYKD
ncbi:DUF4345 domain-containing protein [Dokdonia sinensis]|uniref:DUF4345 domain-containing protein n=1 Tax=Dokdonia sinensis TaxID=2479847 RepID=A0A3M0GH31_9FLAO|nr:DUF4345 domain-containing protein [Dokdonia sinensis]RMB60893.1 DUF4345 domain-containing protein [Dokdonia sinensis]